MGNPPGSAPDEPSHYIRSLGVAQAQWLGDPERPGWPKVNTARVFRVHAALWTTALGCTAFRPLEPAVCLGRSDNPDRHHPPAGRREAGRRIDVVSTAGTYQPFVYVLPGALAFPARDAMTAVRLARLGAAVLPLALLALAIAAAFDPTRPAGGLLGVIVAVTPMVIFVGSSVNPNGTEIAAAICAFSGAARLAREPGRRPAWAALVVGGATVALSRTLGPLWLGLALIALVALAGREGLRHLARPRRRAIGAAVTLAAAVVISLVWEYLVQPRRAVVPDPVYASADLRRLYWEAIGRFGWLDTVLPQWSYIAWSLALLALVAAALVLAGTRGRAVVVGAVVVLLAVVWALWRFLLVPTAVGVQGRYFLPAAVAVPILAGAYIRGSGARAFAGRWVGRVVPPVAGAVHLAAWYVNARRYAVGSGGPWWFLPTVAWPAPAGYIPWLTAAAAGGLALAALGLAGAVRPAEPYVHSRDGRPRRAMPLGRHALLQRSSHGA